MSEKLNFTMGALSRIKPPSEGRQYLYDVKTAGLAFCITATGATAFYWLKKVAGRTERIRLGGFPELTVETVRDLATKLNADVAGGLNPAESKRKRKGEQTLGELWAAFLELHAEAHKKARSVTEDKGLWSRYLKAWESRKLSSVTNREVHTLHSRIGKANGKFAANRMLSLLSKMFNVARNHDEWRKVNPCDGVKRFAELSRDRFLREDEISRFLAAVDAEANQQLAVAFKLLLFTGARKMNVLSMAWSDIDLTATLWRIPDTKQGEPQHVPLIPAAVEVLNQLKADAKPGQDYVFPARVAGTKAGHVVDVTKCWRSVCKAAELPELRMHDLRRTMGSWQAAGGASLQVIGKSLGHRNTSTTEIYARLMLDPVRASMEKAGLAMVAAGTVTANTEGGAK